MGVESGTWYRIRRRTGAMERRELNAGVRCLKGEEFSKALRSTFVSETDYEASKLKTSLLSSIQHLIAHPFYRP